MIVLLHLTGLITFHYLNMLLASKTDKWSIYWLKHLNIKNLWVVFIRTLNIRSVQLQEIPKFTLVKSTSGLGGWELESIRWTGNPYIVSRLTGEPHPLVMFTTGMCIHVSKWTIIYFEYSGPFPVIVLTWVTSSIALSPVMWLTLLNLPCECTYLCMQWHCTHGVHCLNHESMEVCAGQQLVQFCINLAV